MKDLDDLLKEEEDEEQNGYSYTNNANWKVSQNRIIKEFFTFKFKKLL